MPIFLLACANPSIVNIKESETGAISDTSKVYIPDLKENQISLRKALIFLYQV